MINHCNYRHCNVRYNILILPCTSFSQTRKTLLNDIQQWNKTRKLIDSPQKHGELKWIGLSITQRSKLYNATWEKARQKFDSIRKMKKFVREKEPTLDGKR